MENEFKIDNNYIDEAIKCARNVSNYMTGMDDKVKKLANSNLEALDGSFSNINDTLDLFDNILLIEKDIIESKNEALKFVMSLPDFQYQIPLWYKEGKISVSDIVAISGDYMENLVKNVPDYYSKLTTANTMQGVLRSVGFDEEFIDSLSKAFCEDIIKKDLMYSREGIVETSYNFNGFLAMYGWKLTYGPTVGGYFDNLHHGLYLGTENNQQRLTYLDCCNYYDWLARCTGLDIYAYGAGAHYLYAIDVEGVNNPTPKEEYYAYSYDEYFKKGRPGDILETNGNGHLRVIVENDGKGYLVTESTGPGVIYKYYKYEDLSGYHVANMDALYRNTTSGKVGIYRDQHGAYIVDYKDELAEAKNLRGNSGVFFSPKELAKELNLSPEMENELIKQYNKRNQLPNSSKIPEILAPGESGIVIPDSKLPNLEENVTDTSTNIGTTTKPSTSTNTGTTTKPSTSTNTGTTTKPGTSTNAGTTTKPSTSTNTGTTTKPSTSTNTGTTTKPGTSTNTGITSKPGTSTNTGITSKPGTSTNTGITTKPGTSTNTGTTTKPSTSTRPSTPSVSKPSEPSSPNVSVTPNIPSEPSIPSVTYKNILPDNKFSNELPALSVGRLGTMEISKSFVNYEVLNVNNETYGNYIQALLEQGYKMMPDGSFVKGNFQIITSITQDGNMSIYLKQINL